ncbi:MT-A70 family methyltransferase [Ferriphaselus sp. R-1]|uniref:MT-A70 family methyltransferase n=1 Tax=Ferriphaselus sp. R-1 TaxID=1485544 RepID=UPI001376F435|nr:MT-A70 family methyltransferase [Ferriphaselus sp. R-1]
MSNEINVAEMMTIEKIHELIPELKGDEYAALRKDIELRGQLMPIITIDGQVIDGRARLQICKELGIEPIITELGESNTSPAEAAHSLNVLRRHLTTGERSILAAQMINTSKGDNQHSGTNKITRKTSAEKMAVSMDSIDRACKVLKSGSPALIEMVKNDELSLTNAAQIAQAVPSLDNATKNDIQKILKAGIQQTKKKNYTATVTAAKIKAAQELSRNNEVALNSLEGLYSLYYLDPPWDYGGNNESSFCAPDAHYPLMRLDEIKALPIKDGAAPDSMIYMWVPNCMIPDGLMLFTEWGFEFVSTMVWCKDNAVPSEGPTLTSHETLLVGKKGSLPCIKTKRSKSWHHEPRRKHSQKPEHFADMLTAMYPDVAKIEMFAREPRAGWTVWGNEVIGVGAEPVHQVQATLLRVSANDEHVEIAA